MEVQSRGTDIVSVSYWGKEHSDAGVAALTSSRNDDDEVHAQSGVAEEERADDGADERVNDDLDEVHDCDVESAVVEQWQQEEHSNDNIHKAKPGKEIEPFQVSSVVYDDGIALLGKEGFVDGADCCRHAQLHNTLASFRHHTDDGRLLHATQT